MSKRMKNPQFPGPYNNNSPFRLNQNWYTNGRKRLTEYYPTIFIAANVLKIYGNYTLRAFMRSQNFCLGRDMRPSDNWSPHRNKRDKIQKSAMISSGRNYYTPRAVVGNRKAISKIKFDSIRA